MNYELKSAQESTQKQDGVIQSLKDTLKSRESEVNTWQLKPVRKRFVPSKRTSILYFLEMEIVRLINLSPGKF